MVLCIYYNQKELDSLIDAKASDVSWASSYIILDKSHDCSEPHALVQ